MPLPLLIILSALMGYLIIQDWKYRMVPVWSIVLLAVVILAAHLLIYHVNDYLLISLINLGLLAFQLLLLQLYFSLKEKKWATLSSYLGWGDILFFCCMAGTMPTLLFSQVFLGSLLFSLIAFLLLSFFGKIGRQLPLISGAALFFLAFFWTAWWKGFNLYVY